MLAYHLEWHLRKAWAPLLFMDEDLKLADDPITQATRSAEAAKNARLRRTKSGDKALLSNAASTAGDADT